MDAELAGLAAVDCKVGKVSCAPEMLLAGCWPGADMRSCRGTRLRVLWALIHLRPTTARSGDS